MEVKPRISVIIPVLEINHFITDFNLPALEKQTFKDFEVLILPNQVRDTDKALEKQYPFLRLIATGDISNPSEKRNLGVKSAQGDIVAFIDDDAYPQPNWLDKAIEVFTEKGSAVVCGPGLLPPTAKFWERVFNAILCTWLGNSNLTFRVRPEKPRCIDDYPTMNFLIKKEVFNKAGGFLKEYWPGEDSKLCEEIVTNLREKICYDPEVVVHHFRRNSLRKFLHQHAQYGEHRGAFFAQGDKNSRALHYTIPPLFTLYVLSLPIYLLLLKIHLFTLSVVEGLPLSSPLIPYTLYLIPLLIYLILISDLIVQTLFRTKSLLIALTSGVVVFLMHITYGIFFIKGSITRRTGYAKRKI